MTAFVPGLDLARDYWFEVVAPILEPHVRAADRAAALIGEGSEVSGFDTEQSTDHGWGPRVFVLLRDGADRETIRSLVRVVDAALPERFRGYVTRFSARDGAPVRHQVLLTTVGDVVTGCLGFDPRAPMTARDWLQAPTQVLRSMTAGSVFEDGPGDLTAVRDRLAWYPDDVWIYILGCQWRRLDQEEPFVGRCGQVDDDLGSQVVAARLVRDLMRLCFLMERRYAPYSKWLGTAFARLECGDDLVPVLRSALQAREWHEREEHLCIAFERVAEQFNRLGVAEPLDPTVRGFHGRPFRVLASGRFVDACMAATPLRDLGYTGSVDQYVDSTDVLNYPAAVARAADGMWP